ncbi:MAG: sigma-70 family RNA polymerase sigma factor [Chloroflexi bacterium]|nr:sigma-70 family RNA polymerase sigma factor [Chloroflexota bacterium]
MDNEQQAISASLRGNQHAFAQLVAAYQVPVYNLACRMLSSPAEAEDAAQETFLRAYTRLSSYDNQRKFSSWLLSIAAHYCIDRIRRRRNNHVSLDEMEPWQIPPSSDDAPEDVLMRAETRGRVQKLVNSLPENYRICVILRYWHDMPYQEIADILGLTESAVKTRLHRARLMLIQAGARSGSPLEARSQREEEKLGPINRMEVNCGVT